jgi:ribosome-associated protein
MNIRNRNIEVEFVFQTSRSSGPGGQNVNKVSSKVELRFNIEASPLLTEEEKGIILTKLANKINKVGELVIVAQTDRSQLKNKEKVIEKFYQLIEKALTPRKKRLNTKPTKASIEKRLVSKKVKSQIKSARKDVDLMN